MTNVITGFHSIEEKVRAFQKKQNSSDVKIYFAKAGPRVKKIIAQAKEIGIQVFETDDKKLDGFVVSNSTSEAFKLAQELREKGYSIEIDLTNKKFTKQLEKASKIANYALILGEDEINANTVSVKNLATGEQISFAREDVRL